MPYAASSAVHLYGLPDFIEALRNVGCARARNRLHRAKRVVKHIPPVAEHIQNDSAIVFLSVVP